ncbi:AraC family transcriptional regulator [Streptomyces sp. HC44]|uniref:AraC family transcriptional regulator n=1 Tax=Streptomyces scabichelini TaxID=2711217 RepID=A0A6G4V324_9ACTN|nr:AraC family transcriptional regulator [Streptomyces scabichelini]
MGGASPPAVDIAVPYADENRNHVLLSDWRRQAGESLPAPPLTPARHSEGAYQVRIRAQKLLDIPVEDQYSDAVAGGTGGPDGHHGDMIVTHITLSGEWRFTSRNQRSRAGAGTLCVRRNEEPWDFQGLVNDQVMDDADFTPALLEAATGYIEDRLLDDSELNARAIAEALHVSVRTLYRVFAQKATSSVMAYVRERRLERARAELLSTRLTVSEVAARWHFADGRHFVKAYKKHFGETPTAGRRR